MPRVEAILAEGKDRASLIAFYRALGRERSAALFAANRSKYNPATADAIEKLLQSDTPGK